MRFKISFPIAIIVLLATLICACKKDTDDEDEFIWPEPYVPEWLVPYIGVYSGTYYGDDDGNWIFGIHGYTSFVIEFTSSADSSQTFYIAELTESGSFSNYVGGGETWIVSGIISDSGYVNGSWQNHLNNTQGEFLGSKTQKVPGFSLKTRDKPVNAALLSHVTKRSIISK